MNLQPTARPPLPSTSRAISRFLIVAVGVLGVGCGDDPPAAPPGDPAAEPLGYTDPSALVLAHAQALTSQSYAKYEKLLPEDFEYFPQSDDVINFPWLDPPWESGDSWGRTEELQMITHMFDDNFQPVVDPLIAGTVDTIVATMTVVGQRVESDGSHVVDANAVITVLYVSGNGARATLRLEFRLVTGADGYLRIRSIRERLPSLRGTEPELEGTTWARIKARFWEEAAP